MNERIVVDKKTQMNATADVIDKLNQRLRDKGDLSFASRHEILGIVSEEFYELLEAVKNDNNPLGFRNELIDIAVACIFGVASMDEFNMKVSKEKEKS